MSKQAIKDAKVAETEIMQGISRGILHGIPIGLKDLIDVKGVRTTCASKIYKNRIAFSNATIVNQLKEKGAIIYCKENMHTLALGSTGDVSYYGATKNPRNLNKISGGSSSGSAAAVASNISYGSIGSDTGGSIRIPAACCGVVGMKPTFGSISMKGVVSLIPSLDTLGPLTKTVKDNVILLEAIKNPLINLHLLSFLENLNSSIEDVYKIGIPKNFFFERVNPIIKESFINTINKLRHKGHKIIELKIPKMEEMDQALSTIFAWEMYNSMKILIKEQPEYFVSEIRKRILEGQIIDKQTYLDTFKFRQQAIDIFNQLLQKVDLIITPTLIEFPCEIGQRELILDGEKTHIRKIYSRLVRASNLTGFPAISVPNGVSDNGLTTSVQIIGLPNHEKELYQMAYEVENMN